MIHCKAVSNDSSAVDSFGPVASSGAPLIFPVRPPRCRGVEALPSAMSIGRKAVAGAIVIALLMFLASRSFAAEADVADSDTGGPNPGAALELMAQQKFGPALTVAERKLMHA